MPDITLTAADPVLIFAVLLLTALTAPLIAEKFNLPGIIGLILAGIILGPHGSGVLERGLEVELLGTVGLLYIMFLAGLELDLVQFLKHRHHSFVFGALTFLIPLILGSLMGRYLLGFTWPASVLLASMFSSHTLITYPIASRLGLNRQRAVTTAVGGTLFTDTAALLVLAVIAAAHRGEATPAFWSRLFSHMIVYIAASVIILPRLARWFFRSIASEGAVAFTAVLGAVFLSAHMAHVAGLEPIIGAFLAGLILNSLIPENSTLMNRLQFVGNSLFIPFFLISVGMLVNLRHLFAGGEAAVIAVSMVAAGIITKLMASDLSKRILSYTDNEGMLIYGLSVNQAAATLAAVLVGFNIGIFAEPVITGTVIMILVTSLAGSWVTDKYARRVALEEEDKPYSPSDAPHRILIPLANPQTAEELMTLAMLIRRRNSHEPLYPMAVVQAGDRAEERIAEAEKLLGYAVVKASASDVPVIPVTRAALDVSSGVLQAITDLRISTVIAGWKGSVSSHSRSFGHILDTVKSESRQMFLVSRCHSPLNVIKRVILAVPPLIEHQPGFETAVRAAKTLTHQMGASLLTVSVPPGEKSVREIIEANPPKLNEQDISLKEWGGLMGWLEKNLSIEEDLLLLLSVRKGMLAWQPLLTRLPRLIASKFPDINLVALYPPAEPWRGESEVPESGKTDISHLLPARQIKLGMRGASLKEASAELIGTAFPEKPGEAEKLAEALTGGDGKDPMELTPGAALIHSHIPGITESTVFLGVNPDGWDIPHTTEKVRLLFILLSPSEASPEIHLQALARVAGPLRHSGAVEKIVRSGDGCEKTEIYRHFR